MAEPTKVEQLFPVGRRVKLDNGEFVEIKKWSIEKTARMARLLPEAFYRLLERIKDAPDTAAKMRDAVPLMLDDMVLLVAETLDWTAAQVNERMTGEDLFTVATEIWEFCVAGTAAKAAGLVNRIVGVVAQPSPKVTPETRSSKPSPF